MNGEIATERLYPIQKAAEIWGVSPVTVRFWARKGLIKTRKLGRRRLVPGSEIRRILEEGL